MPNFKPIQVTHKFKVGDEFRSNGHALKVTGLIVHEGAPAYEVRGEYTAGEPWLMAESWLVSMRDMQKAEEK